MTKNYVIVPGKYCLNTRYESRKFLKVKKQIYYMTVETEYKYVAC